MFFCFFLSLFSLASSSFVDTSSPSSSSFPSPLSVSCLVSPTVPCTSSLSCSLNGVCLDADGDEGDAIYQCHCSAAWTGACCQTLALLPVNVNSSYRQDKVSTWGGNIVKETRTTKTKAKTKTKNDDNTDIFHMWIAEMIPDPILNGSCGLTTWETNSQITHVVSSSPSGPYTRISVAVPVWSHNPIVRVDPTVDTDADAADTDADADADAAAELLVMWHIGDGTNNGKQPNYCYANGTSPCGEQSFDQCAKTQTTKKKTNKLRAPSSSASSSSSSSCTLPIHTSSSFSGPWSPYASAVITPCAGNNPSPFFHPLNGTLYAVFTEQNMGMWKADTWRGPYTLITEGACGGGEDPSLYIDNDGYFHCLYHRAPFSNPDIAIGHAFSIDGFTWYVSDEAAANSTIEYENYGSVVHGKRERPHLYFDENNEITHFVTGVCLDPACSPFPSESAHGYGVDGVDVDCSSGAQYYRCDANSPDGWYDKTYTLVQPVRTKN